MDQELLVRQIMQEVMKNMKGSSAACECEGKVTVEDYPLGEKQPHMIKSASGKTLDELTLQQINWLMKKLQAKTTTMSSLTSLLITRQRKRKMPKRKKHWSVKSVCRRQCLISRRNLERTLSSRE